MVLARYGSACCMRRSSLLLSAPAGKIILCRLVRFHTLCFPPSSTVGMLSRGSEQSHCNRTKKQA